MTPDADDLSVDAQGRRWRRCIVSGDRVPETLLVRFVADPAGAIVPDVAAELPGRGCWVRAAAPVLGEAIKRKLFARALKRTVEIGDDLAVLTRDRLAERVRGGLGMARRAGALVTGFEGVTKSLKAGRGALLFEAVDGAAGGRGKVLALAAGACPGLPVAAVLPAARLGEALGTDPVVHALLAESGRHADRLLRDAARLAGFVDPPAWPVPSGLMAPATVLVGPQPGDAPPPD